MNEITENLLITDIDTVRTRSLDQFRIDAVVTVCQEDVSFNISNDKQYRYFNMSDGEDDYGGSSDYQLFHQAVSTVLGLLNEGHRTVVHCHRGRSRSAAVCIAAYAVRHNTDYMTAYSAVEEARPIIDPNPKLKGHARRYIEEYT